MINGKRDLIYSILVAYHANCIQEKSEIKAIGSVAKHM
jgi:hypothetical protein